MRNKPIKIGIIGTGGIAQGAHLPAYAKTAGVEVVAGCDIREEALQEASRKFGIPRVYADYRKMLQEEQLDGVSVCTPNVKHMAPAIAALRAGVNVLCEKPIAMNSREGQAMCAAARRARRILMVAFNSRFSAQSQALKKFIGGGDLGRIYFARVQALRRRGIPGWGVFTEKAKSGGGPLIDIGVHMLDLALWLMGHPKPVSVSGGTYCNFGKRRNVFAPWGPWDPEKYTVEDMGVGFVRFQDGSTMVLESSWAAHIEDTWKVTLVGSEGGATTKPLQILKEKHQTLLDVTPQRLPDNDTYADEIGAFVETIRRGGKSPVPGEEALMATRILDGIYRSSALKREVRL